MSAEICFRDVEMEVLNKAISKALDCLINDPGYWVTGELDILATAHRKLVDGLDRRSRRRRRPEQ